MKSACPALFIIIISLFSLGVTYAGKVDPSLFAASDEISVPALQAAIAKTSKVPKLAAYPVSINQSSATSIIHTDWASFDKGAAITWVADMDVDCDGLEYGCQGNPDGQPQTNWGALAAFDVPFIVIPDQFLAANQDMLPGNNIAAVICNNKMYYAILGDSNHNDPQVTGEASWLLAQTCFPNENLNGNKGHTVPDVTYIVFTGKDAVLPDTAVDQHYITDFDLLRSMGDDLFESLAENLDRQLSGDEPEPEPQPEPESESSIMSRPAWTVLALTAVGIVMCCEVI